ncbi:MAG: glycosyltransferase family 4 protein [Ignavibacteria bacterium]|nr:glycosyltransferase family 4 protein [Ignavibacteria bacterium]
MKVVYLGRYNPSDILSGPEKVARRIFFIHAQENETEFITYFFDGNQHGLWKKLFGHETLAMENNGKVVRCGIVSVLFRLMTQRPDVIHIINYERFAKAALLYKRFSKTRIIYTVHGIAAYENSNFKSVPAKYMENDLKTEASLFKYADKIVFLSEQSLRIAESIYEIDKAKCVILPNGIDEEFHSESTKNFDSTELNIVFIGNIERSEKGFEILKDALSSLEIDFKLHVINSGRKGSDGKIFYYESMDTKELAAFLANKHIFISSGSYEPFSLSAVEAMASGLVAIVSGDTGMSRYIDNGINGFVYETIDTQQIPRIINQLQSNRTLLRSISNEAKKIYSTLSWRKVYELYKELYK